MFIQIGCTKNYYFSMLKKFKVIEFSENSASFIEVSDNVGKESNLTS